MTAPPNYLVLHELHKRYAIWTKQQFQLRYPQMDVSLYQRQNQFALHILADVPNFDALKDTFDHEIRPVTVPISLVREVSSDMVLLDFESDYATEAWLRNEPNTNSGIDRLLALATPGLPRGSLQFDATTFHWSFITEAALPATAQASVREAFDSLGLPGDLAFTVRCPPTQRSQPAHARSGPDFTVQVSSHMDRISPVLRQLMERDEDEWRRFINSRPTAPEEVPAETIYPKPAACLLDANDESDVELSELLTLYERVDILPRAMSVSPLGRLKTNTRELCELAQMNRIRLILPYSIDRYENALIEAVAEIDRESVMLTRSLATKVLSHGQRKEPLLYAPLTADQRALVLKALLHVTKDGDPFQKILLGYSRIMAGQHYALIERGANACIGFGVGSYLGDVLFALHGNDIRVELTQAGAHVEWALALEASLIPLTVAGGFSLHNFSTMVASYLGRTKHVPTNPASNRMHILSDGLLAVSGVPALEVARSLGPNAVTRFRGVAQRMLRACPSDDEMHDAVAALNAEVQAFERRTDRLHRWGISALTEEVCHFSASKAIYAAAGVLPSVLTLWLLKVLPKLLPERARAELTTVADFITGLVLSPSVDAVIVDRVKREIHKKA